MPKRTDHTDYPVVFKMEVLIASIDGEQLGVASGPQTFGLLPVESDALEAIASTSAIMPAGFRLATPEEMYQWLASERGMGNIHVACAKDWKKRKAIDEAILVGREAAKAAEERDDEEDA